MRQLIKILSATSLFLSLAVMALGQALPKPTGTQPPNPANPIAAALNASYLFNEGSGSIIHDNVNNIPARQGVAAAAPTWAAAGVSAGSFSVPAANAAFLKQSRGTTGFAWEARYVTVTNAAGTGYLMGVGTNTSTATNQVLLYYNAGTYYAYNYNGGTSEVLGMPRWDQAEHDLIWNVLPDGSEEFYYDGILLSTTTAPAVSYNPAPGQAPATEPYEAGADYFLGGGYPGTVEALRQYSRSLTPSEAATLAASPYGTVASPMYAAASASSYTLLPGTATVQNGVAQTFTVTPNAAYTGTITPTDGGAGGTFAPTSLTYSSEATAKTFTYAPSSGIQRSITISAAASPALGTDQTATVTAYPAVAVSLSPSSSPNATSGQPLTLTATLTGGQTGQSQVLNLTTSAGTLSATTVSSGGTFTIIPPAGQSGTLTVTATSVQDGTKSATASVTYAPGVSVALDQASQTVAQLASVTVNATVSGSSGSTAVTWSGTALPYTSGSANQKIFTAPATAGSYTLTATSVADGTKTASVTFSIPSVAVVITSPASPVTLSLSTTQQFTATVSGSTNTAVSWSITEGASGGSITSGGLYTSPSNAGTYHIVVTSQADVTKSASWTVNAVSTVQFPVSVNFGATIGSGQTAYYTVLDASGATLAGRSSVGVIDLGQGNYGTNLSVPGGYKGFVKWDVTPAGGSQVVTAVATLAPVSASGGGGGLTTQQAAQLATAASYSVPTLAQIGGLFAFDGAGFVKSNVAAYATGQDPASLVWGYNIESGVTARNVLQILGATQGGNYGSGVFKAVGNSTINRVSYTTNSTTGVRTITLTLSP